MKNNKLLKTVLLFLVLAVLVKSVNEFSFFIARGVYPLVSALDPDNAWLLITVHHIVQALLALGLIRIYGKWRGIGSHDFGFRKILQRSAMNVVFLFVIVWGIVQFLSGYLLVAHFNEPIVFAYPLTIGNFTGHLLFQLLLTGTSEELLFRVLVITVLADQLRRHYPEKGLTVLLIAASTVIFMFDHINFDYSTFAVTHFNLLQQVTLMIFGMFYGWLYLRYRNYWHPALAHGLLNGIISLVTLVLFFMLR